MCVFHRLHPSRQDGSHQSLHHNDTLNWLRQITLMYQGAARGGSDWFWGCYEQWVGIHQERLLLVLRGVLVFCCLHPPGPDRRSAVTDPVKTETVSVSGLSGPGPTPRPLETCESPDDPTASAQPLLYKLCTHLEGRRPAADLGRARTI